jgi:gamma-glutamyltranspeptidase/glutathione hydrolase
MHAMGKDNPMSWHLIAEAMRLAYADRDAYVGDPDFVDVPTAGLLDERYLAQRAQLISPFSVASSYTPGMPPRAAPRTAATGGEVPSTSHFVAVDRTGNVASMTSTVEGIFGSQLIARGMVLNNELTDFSMEPERNGAPVANRVEPGKRPRSSMSPTIVYNAAGQPILALGSAGGPRIIMHVAKTLIGVLDFGLPVDEAIALPNIYMAGGGDVMENTPLGTAIAPQLARFGRPVMSTDLPSKVNAAQRDADGSGWTGAADPRSVGAVAVQ